MALRDFLSRLRGGAAAQPRASAGYTMTVARLEDLTAEQLNGGGTASGAHVTPLGSLQNAAVFRSVNLISTAVASSPAHLYQEDETDSRIKTKAREHPVYQLVYLRPNPRMGSYEFRRIMHADLLLRGNAYALKVMGGNGYARELWRLNPDRVEPMEREDLSVVYRYTRKDGRHVVFNAEEILHLRDLSQDGVKGLSRIAQAREAVGLALRAEEYGATTFKEGASLGGVMEHPKRLDDKSYERLRQSLRENYSGAENAGKWLIAEEGMQAKPLSMTNADAQWLELRRYQVAEIAGMFYGLPPYLWGDAQQTNWGTGIEGQNIGFQTFTLLPEARIWEEALALALLKPEELGRFYFKFNSSAYLRASAKDRGDYFSKALGSGGGQAWMTPDEVREKEELPPIAGGAELPPRAAAAASPAADSVNPE